MGQWWLYFYDDKTLQAFKNSYSIQTKIVVFISKFEPPFLFSGCYGAIATERKETIDLICPLENSKNSIKVFIRNKKDENTKAFWDDSFSQNIVSSNIDMIENEKEKIVSSW